jgi:hypothetical protein
VCHHAWLSMGILTVVIDPTSTENLSESSSVLVINIYSHCKTVWSVSMDRGSFHRRQEERERETDRQTEEREGGETIIH